METRALRYFQTVAECGSYSRGARLLRISQPAVSRQIRSLEAELGRPLFKRHGHGVSLTPAGRVLLERSQVALRQLEQTRAEIRAGSASPSGVISFAVPPAAGHFLVPALIERFSAAFPIVFLQIRGGFSGTIHEWLARGQVDVACVHDLAPLPGFEILPLLEEPVYLVSKRGAAPFRRDHARVEDLTGLPLILPSRPNASRRQLDGWVAARRLALNVRLEADDHSIIRALIKKGAGFSLLTRGAFEAELRRGEVEAFPFRPAVRWPLALVAPAGVPRSDILEAFIGAVRATARALTKSGTWPARSLDKI